MFHLDVDGLFTCLVHASIDKIMHVWTFAVSGTTPMPVLSRDNAPLKLPCLLAHTSDWGVLEHSRILTPWARHSSWPYLVTPNLHVWEAFPMPEVLIHIKITWALSPMVPQVPGVTSGSSWCPLCFKLSLCEMHNTKAKEVQLWIWSLNILWSLQMFHWRFANATKFYFILGVNLIGRSWRTWTQTKKHPYTLHISKHKFEYENYQAQRVLRYIIELTTYIYLTQIWIWKYIEYDI